MTYNSLGYLYLFISAHIQSSDYRETGLFCCRPPRNNIYDLAASEVADTKWLSAEMSKRLRSQGSGAVYIQTGLLRSGYTAFRNAQWLIARNTKINSQDTTISRNTWWRHQMETFSALLALCEGNPLVTCGFPSQSQWCRALMKT